MLVTTYPGYPTSQEMRHRVRGLRRGRRLGRNDGLGYAQHRRPRRRAGGGVCEPNVDAECVRRGHAIGYSERDTGIDRHAVSERDSDAVCGSHANTNNFGVAVLHADIERLRHGLAERECDAHCGSDGDVFAVRHSCCDAHIERCEYPFNLGSVDAELHGNLHADGLALVHTEFECCVDTGEHAVPDSHAQLGVYAVAHRRAVSEPNRQFSVHALAHVDGHGYVNGHVERDAQPLDGRGADRDGVASSHALLRSHAHRVAEGCDSDGDGDNDQISDGDNDQVSHCDEAQISNGDED